MENCYSTRNWLKDFYLFEFGDVAYSAESDENVSLGCAQVRTYDLNVTKPRIEWMKVNWNLRPKNIEIQIKTRIDSYWTT